MSSIQSNIILQNEYAIAAYEAALADPGHETKSRSAWNYILSKILFFEDHYRVDPEDAPSVFDDRRKVDLVLKYFTRPGGHELRVLLFIECKKHIVYPSDLDEVEHQAFSAAHSLLTYLNGRGPVYVMTAIGMRAHMWRLDSLSDDYLSGFDGSAQPLSDPETYVDIGSNNATIIYNQLMQLKAGAEQHRNAQRA